MLTEQAKASGRPDNVIAKMVEGRVQKFYEEVALLEQVWVHDGKSRVKDVVKNASATITGFDRFALGEGIEKPKEDFAAEVAATAATPSPPRRRLAREINRQRLPPSRCSTNDPRLFGEMGRRDDADDRTGMSRHCG